MRSVSFYCLLILMLSVPAAIHAQQDSATNKVNFKFGTYYNTNLNYYGRTDTLRSSAVFPLAELWFNNHLYVNAAPVFVNNAKQSFDYAGTVATMGYQFDDQKNWAGNFYVVKPFYKDNSIIVQSALKAQVSSLLTSKNKIVNITGGVDLKFSDKTDIGATAGLNHIFRHEFPGKVILAVNPSAFINAGTQQFVNTYYRKNNFLFFPGTEQSVTETVKKFNLLSYELSLPVVIAKGKFQVLVIPAYVIPENLVIVQDRPDLSEHGRNLFYATIGAKVSF